MTILHFIFYVFASIAVLSAVSVVSAKNPVSSVLSLVVTFFASAGIWLLLRAEFLSLILILVYVGAVMTLFLFVVMMLNIDREMQKKGWVQYLPFGIALILLLVFFAVITFKPAYFGLSVLPQPKPYPANYSNTAVMGELLFTEFAYPFEIAGVILLAAMIAAIALTHKGSAQGKRQRISKQINTRPEECVRLIKMPSEKKRGEV